MQSLKCLSVPCRFYTDAYDLFFIRIAKPMIATVYFPQLNGKLAKTDDLWITGVALVGTLVGQVSLIKLPLVTALGKPVAYGHHLRKHKTSNMQHPNRIAMHA